MFQTANPSNRSDNARLEFFARTTPLATNTPSDPSSTAFLTSSPLTIPAPQSSLVFGFDPVAFLRAASDLDITDGAVMVKMMASGVCGTDLEKLTGKGITSSILGHEVAGVISQSKNDEFNVGDYVIPHHHVSCNNCELCSAGAQTMCAGFKSSNFVPGGFSTEFIVPNYNVAHGGLHAMSKNLSFDEASFAEPLGCCLRGLEHAGIFSKKPRNILVVGSGPIGLLHMELIRSALPDAKIYAVDVLVSRLDFAEKNEDAIPIDAKKSSQGAFSIDALKHTNGFGFDLVLVATGSKSAFAESLKCLRKSGTLLLFGAPHKGATHDLDLAELFLSEYTITSSYSTSERELAQAIKLLEDGKINVRKFITSKFPLDRIEEAMATARKDDQVKTIVTS